MAGEKISVSSDMTGAIELRLDISGYSMCATLDQAHLAWLIVELQKHVRASTAGPPVKP